LVKGYVGEGMEKKKFDAGEIEPSAQVEVFDENNEVLKMDGKIFYKFMDQQGKVIEEGRVEPYKFNGKIVFKREYKEGLWLELVEEKGLRGEIRERMVLKVAKIKVDMKREKFVAKPIHIIVYAGGFKYEDYYPSYPKDELKALEKKKWWPTSRDFERAALRVSEKEEVKAYTKAFKVENMEDFVKIIEEQTDESVGIVSVIAHGSSGGVYFGGEQSFNPNHDGISRIRGKFTRKKARIVFYSCRSGGDEGFLQMVAESLGIRAQGFSKGLNMVVLYDRKKKLIHEDSRGQFRLSDKKSSKKIVDLSDKLLKPDMEKEP